MSLLVGTVQNNNLAYEQALDSQGIITGAVASAVCGTICTIPSKLLFADMQKMNSNLSTLQIENVRNAIQEALYKSKLSQNGVKFIELVTQKPKGWRQHLTTNVALQTLFGKNACFISKGWYLKDNKKIDLKNTILVPHNKMVYSWFHEMGHAINWNFTKSAKFLQKLRGPLQKAAFIIPIIALLSKKRKEQEGKELSTYDKTINLIRNNAGKLTFLCFLPTLIEEGMATAKGQKWAEKLLPKDIAKNVLKHNKLAFLTYAIYALSAGFCAYAGVKAKDLFIDNMKKQQQNKLAA